MLFVAIVAVVAFLIGSIPFGLLLGLVFTRTDIRSQGSGNIGAMNALRTLGFRIAIPVLLLDAAKGFAPTFIAAHIHYVHFANMTMVAHEPSPLAAVAGIAAILGHCFSPWLGFKGGKGVATAFGVLAALSWPALLCCLVVWVLGALVLTRFSSVGSMAANLAAPIALWFFTGSPAFVIYGVLAGLLIVWAHRENIARLASGTENRIKLKRG